MRPTHFTFLLILVAQAWGWKQTQAQRILFVPAHATPYALGATVTTLAGTAGSSGNTDGAGVAARFTRPMGIAVGADGTVYVVDEESLLIRKITSTGAVSTLAGTAGSQGSTDGAGAAARFYHPVGVAIDADGSLYVTDADNQTIRKITAAGVVTTLAGAAGSKGSADGPGPSARFNLPHGLAVDAAGTVYVADTFNHTIRKITPAGVVTALVGLAGHKGSTDGQGVASRFNLPAAVVVDAQGTLYVADNGNQTIRKITPAGLVTTLAGTAGKRGPTDGLGPVARFRYPAGLAVDAAGNVYVADHLNALIRKITPEGMVTTIAGTALDFGSADGAGPDARFNGPTGIAAGANGSLYVTDSNNHTIRIIK